MANDFGYAVVGKFHALGIHSVALRLFRNQVAFSDLRFFAFGITRQIQDFQAVLQRGRNRVQHIRRRNEKHLRQIVINVEIMIAERGILFRVENFQKRGGRIAAKILAELINFVKQNHRIIRSGAFHQLHDLSRQRADISAAMPANLGFVVNAA